MAGAKLSVMRLHSRQEFQVWLASEVEVRAELEAMIGADLDVSEKSLDVLEGFLLRRFRSIDEAVQPDNRPVLDAAARHIGLIMLLNVDGAHWDIDVDNEDNVYYQLPVIRFSDGAEECPLSMVGAALDRRTGVYLRTLVENYEEEYNTGADE
jgi:hypothetical protein